MSMEESVQHVVMMAIQEVGVNVTVSIFVHFIIENLARLNIL